MFSRLLPLLFLFSVSTLPLSTATFSGAGTIFTLCYVPGFSNANTTINVTTQLVSWNGNSGAMIATTPIGNLSSPSILQNVLTSSINPVLRRIYWSFRLGDGTSNVVIYGYNSTSVWTINTCIFSMKTMAVSNQGIDEQSIFVVQGPNFGALYVLNTTTCQSTYISSLGGGNVRGTISGTGGHILVVYPPTTSVYFLDDMSANLIQINYMTGASNTYPVNTLPGGSQYDLGISLSEQSILFHGTGASSGLYRIPITSSTSIGNITMIGNKNQYFAQVIEFDSMSSVNAYTPGSFYVFPGSVLRNAPYCPPKYVSLQPFLSPGNAINSNVMPLNVIPGQTLCQDGFIVDSNSVVDRYMDIPVEKTLCSDMTTNPPTTKTPTTSPPSGNPTTPDPRICQIDSDCSSTSYCPNLGTGTCQPSLLPGSTCDSTRTTTKQCSNGFCDSVNNTTLGICTPLYANGHVCSVGNQCSSGYCASDSKTCQTNPLLEALAGAGLALFTIIIIAVTAPIGICILICVCCYCCGRRQTPVVVNNQQPKVAVQQVPMTAPQCFTGMPQQQQWGQTTTQGPNPYQSI